MDIKVRVATKADLRDILRLYAQPQIDNGKALPLDEATKLFHRIESYPDYSLHVACIDGEVVGSFALLIMDNLGHLGGPSGIVEECSRRRSRSGGRDCCRPPRGGFPTRVGEGEVQLTL